MWVPPPAEPKVPVLIARYGPGWLGIDDENAIMFYQEGPLLAVLETWHIRRVMFGAYLYDGARLEAWEVVPR